MMRSSDLFMRRCIRHHALALLCLLLPLCAARAAAPAVTLVGTDLLGAEFSAGVTAFAQRTHLAVALKLSGSRPGLEALQAGTADLALLMFAANEKPPAAPFVARPVAFCTAAVVVPAGLPLEQLNFAQLRALYAEAEPAPPKFWFNLGLSSADDWGRRPVTPMICGPGGGLSFDLFRHTVLTAPALRAAVTVDDDSPATVRHLLATDGGIAILPLPPTGRRDVKTLPIARGTREVAFTPTAENIYSGDYPLRLPVQVVFRADAAKRLLPLLRFLYSPEAAPLWQGANLMPLPTTAREGQVIEFEAM
jgi:phosphate transport system substrate-binding protein